MGRDRKIDKEKGDGVKEREVEKEGERDLQYYFMTC